MTALSLAAEVADELLAGGAAAVVLVGSWARGEGRPQSDLDLTVLGREAPPRLDWRGGRLVSISHRSAAAIRADFLDPAIAGIAVPTWQLARILVDPHGRAAALKAEALGWTWDRIDGETLDAWVAEAITGYAEEVLKLRGTLAGGDPMLGAVIRSTLAIRLAPILAVDRRMLFASEDHVWSGVALRLGEAWSITQRDALHGSGEAALALFRLAVDDVARLLDDRQRRVVEGALGHMT